jgi:hypothetical protein
LPPAVIGGQFLVPAGRPHVAPDEADLS